MSNRFHFLQSKPQEGIWDDSPPPPAFIPPPSARSLPPLQGQVWSGEYARTEPPASSNKPASSHWFPNALSLLGNGVVGVLASLGQGTAYADDAVADTRTRGLSGTASQRSRQESLDDLSGGNFGEFRSAGNSSGISKNRPPNIVEYYVRTGKMPTQQAIDAEMDYRLNHVLRTQGSKALHRIISEPSFVKEYLPYRLAKEVIDPDGTVNLDPQTGMFSLNPTSPGNLAASIPVEDPREIAYNLSFAAKPQSYNRPVVGQKDPVTSSFTRAVNAAVGQRKPQQGQLLAQAQPKTEIQTKVLDPFEPLFYEEQNPLTGKVRVVEVEQKRVPKTAAELKAAQNRQKQMEQNTLKQAQKPVAPPNVAKGVPSKDVLNQEQALLNNLFGAKVFSKTEMNYPYDADKNGNLIADRNVARLIGVARWILERQAKTSYTPLELQQMQDWLKSGGLETITSEQRRQLAIGAQLHEILKNNEELGKKRDDAKAFSQGLGVIIQANTDKHGVVNVDQFTRDLAFFTIDHESKFVNVSGAVHSNAAYNLMGGPRLGAVGWKEMYWDKGLLYEDGHLRNQAHHFSYFFAEVLKAKNDSFHRRILKNTPRPLEAFQKEFPQFNVPELQNNQDIVLGRAAVTLAEMINDGRLTWAQIPQAVYQTLSDKY